MNTPDILDSLSEAQLVLEVRYLRSTLAPNIRERVKVDKKFRKLSKTELINEILKVIKPESDGKILDSLFVSLFPNVDDTDDSLEDLPVVSPDKVDSDIHPGLAGPDPCKSRVLE